MLYRYWISRYRIRTQASYVVTFVSKPIRGIGTLRSVRKVMYVQVRSEHHDSQMPSPLVALTRPIFKPGKAAVSAVGSLAFFLFLGAATTKTPHVRSPVPYARHE
ncbi:hypothetical protein N656DRAFT_605909 [Canariomyces notabilis]|uniref:Uncharacterized protein n=1 Tax=Canariomyces notabilis TaxID=2074819 RepID=A0AAN6TG94_9PEZI|nr:hypothetical protein N656DRAFT_605909 [Canariomyces arenarius]